MRFDARSLEDGWGVWDGGTAGWRCTCPSQAEAEHRALELNLAYDQYGPRPPQCRRDVVPPVPVDRWVPAGKVVGWVRERGRWVAAVLDAQDYVQWIDGQELRRHP